MADLTYSKDYVDIKEKIKDNKDEYKRIKGQFFSQSSNVWQDQSRLQPENVYNSFRMTPKLNVGKDELLKELYKRKMNDQEYEDDKYTLQRSIAELELKGQTVKMNDLKQLLTERNQLKNRDDEYFRQVENFIIQNQGGDVKDSIERNHILMKLKHMRERNDIDRSIVMNKYFTAIYGEIPQQLPMSANQSNMYAKSSAQLAAQNVLGSNYSSIQQLNQSIAQMNEKISQAKMAYQQGMQTINRNAQDSTFINPDMSTRIDQSLTQSYQQPPLSYQNRGVGIPNQILPTNLSVNQSFQNQWNLGNNNYSQVNQTSMQMDEESKEDQFINAETIFASIKKGKVLANQISFNLAGVDPALKQVSQNKTDSVFSTLFPEFDEEEKEMTPEEKKLIQMITQEGDAKRALSRIPTNTPMYLSKLQDIENLSKARQDLERIVQEQRYQRVRQNYEQEQKRQNIQDPDDIRKKDIQVRLKNSLRWKQRHYQSIEGFAIYWDFLLNLPKKYEKCKISFGIFKKGETLFPPRFVEDHICGEQNYNCKMCLFVERDHVYDILADKDVLLVIELQCIYKDFQEKPIMDIYGWSLIELFDMNNDLMRGKWKIPFYSNKINPNILLSQSKQLKSQSDTLLYLRIAFPLDDEFGNEEPLHPFQITNEYYVPIIHKRTIIQKMIDYDFLKKKEEQYNKELQEQEESEEEDFDEQPKVDFIKKEEGDEDIPYPDQRKGLHVTIHNIQKFENDKRTKVKLFLVDVKRGIVKDDLEEECIFETPLTWPEIPLAEGKGFKIIEQNQLVSEGIVIFENDTHFFLDIDTYAHNNKSHGDLYLLFQMYTEKHVFDPEIHYDEGEEEKALKSKDEDEYSYEDEPPPGKVKVVEEDAVEEAPIEKGKNPLIGVFWYAFPLYREKTLKLGRYIENIFDLPIKKPPFELSELHILETQLDFELNYFFYGKDGIRDLKRKFNDMEKLKQNNRKLPPKKKKPKIVKKKPPKNKWDGIPLDDRPFIENTKRQYHDRPFEKGSGVDFYIDSARFLPDNVSCCKIACAYINHNFDKLFDPDSALPDFKSRTYMPNFEYRRELRSPHFDPTCEAFLTIMTVDYSNKEVRIVGYSVINFFLNRKTKMQPTDQLDANIILQNGFYQIPIFCQHPPRIKPFNVERFLKLDRLPCSSLLVRIHKAPMSEDGMRCLSVDDKDLQPEQFRKLGLIVDPPPYGTKLFNTNNCQLRDSEKELFMIRMTRKEPNQVERLQEILSYDKITKEMSLAESKIWLDEKLKRTPYTDIIDMIHFAKYQPSSGFKFSLDGFHNSPISDYPLISLFTLNPPGEYYLSQTTKSVMINTSFNWDSPLHSPMYNEGYFSYHDMKADSKLHILMDIRQVRLSEKLDKAIIEPIGWTICEVFTYDGYIKSGIYQIPVFQGEVPIKFIQELAKTSSPWEFIQEELKQKRKKPIVKYYESMSVIVRLLDGQREGHFQVPFDHTRMNYDYIPKDKMGNYSYNQAVEVRLQKETKLMKLVPNKAKVQEFNDIITRQTILTLGIEKL